MKKAASLIIIFLVSCAQKNTSTSSVQIALINNGRQLEFKGLDYAVIQEINRDSSTDVWQALIPVYRMPVDTDMKNYQPEQPGRYHVKDSVVVFTPDTPFIKGKAYFVRNYKLGQKVRLADLIQGRGQPGKLRFTDLIFKQ
jgi:hypothetical protein